MVIILKYIPAKTTTLDLKKFVTPAVKGSFFSKSGTIKSVSILVNKYRCEQVVEYHGIIDIEPEAVAQRVIKNFKRQSLHGKFIAISQYHERNWHNDRRLFNQLNNEIHIEKRVADRRNNYTQVIGTDRFVTNNGFRHKLA